DARLVVEIDADLVFLRRLPREPRVDAVLLEREEAAPAPVLFVGPFRRGAFVLVVVEARDVVVTHLPARRGVEPELVAKQRTAHRRIDVVRAFHLVGIGKPAVLQFVSEVAALPGRVHSGREDRPFDGIAALSWNEVDAETAEWLLGRPRRAVHAVLL